MTRETASRLHRLYSQLGVETNSNNYQFYNDIHVLMCPLLHDIHILDTP